MQNAELRNCVAIVKYNQYGWNVGADDLGSP